MSFLCAWFGFWCAASAQPSLRRPAPPPAEEVSSVSPAQPLPPIVGRATVQDGDTLIVAGRVVRLQGVDAPEMGQNCDDAQGRAWRCGRAAADALDRMAGGRIATCRQDARDAEDRYGRALGRCEVDGEDLGAAMLRAGQAIAYRRYLIWPDRSERAHARAYIAAEADARAARRGLWAGRFDPPEDWRRGRSTARQR